MEIGDEYESEWNGGGSIGFGFGIRIATSYEGGGSEIALSQINIFDLILLRPKKNFFNNHFLNNKFVPELLFASVLRLYKRQTKVNKNTVKNIPIVMPAVNPLVIELCSEKSVIIFFY